MCAGCKSVIRRWYSMCDYIVSSVLRQNCQRSSLKGVTALEDQLSPQTSCPPRHVVLGTEVPSDVFSDAWSSCRTRCPPRATVLGPDVPPPLASFPGSLLKKQGVITPFFLGESLGTRLPHPLDCEYDHLYNRAASS